MFDDNDIDEASTVVEADEWHIPDLALEFKGEKGNVEFRPLEDLSGAQLDMLRSKLGQAKNDGDMANTYYLEAARILITGWDIPGKPMLPIPKGDPKSWGAISLVLRRQIEKYMASKLDPVLSNKKDEDADPFGPGSPSRPASA